jgi:hypothetical protein
VDGSGRWPDLRYCPGICLEGLRKKYETQGRRSPGQDLNPGSPITGADCQSAGCDVVWAGTNHRMILLVLFLWDLAPCRLVGRCQRFGETYCLHLQGWRWSLHGAKTQENIVIIIYVEVLRYHMTLSTGELGWTRWKLQNLKVESEFLNQLSNC